jgi:hypothetical protein
MFYGESATERGSEAPSCHPEYQFMSLERHLKLAQADSHIEEAERNIRHVESLLPVLTAQGYATVDIETQLGLMSEALHHLKEQRRLIVETFH